MGAQTAGFEGVIAAVQALSRARTLPEVQSIVRSAERLLSKVRQTLDQ